MEYSTTTQAYGAYAAKSNNDNYNNNNNSTKTKRKYIEEQVTNQYQNKKSQLIQSKDNKTYSISEFKVGHYRLSPNATANRGNAVLSNNTPTTTIEIDTMMIDDDYTDEDETLQTPVNTSSNYIPYNSSGEDLDQGGFIGTLELGWSQMYNE